MARKFKDYTVNRYDGIVEHELLPMKEFEGPISVSLGESGVFDVVRNGIGGNTVARAIKRIEDFTGILANGKEPDITFMMFGINDALSSDPSKYVTPEEFKKNYSALVTEVKKRNPNTVIILMTATYNGFGIREYCLKTVQLGWEKNLPIVDLHALWSEHYDENADNYGQGNWLVGKGDGCHPTPLAAEIMGKTICDWFYSWLGLQ